MIEENQIKFTALKEMNLPLGEYMITGSGALGIRNLREIGDIDIVVTPSLWKILAAKYGITMEIGYQKIVFPGNLIEAFGEDSYYGDTEAKDPKAKNVPKIAERIAMADIIDGLPFECLEHVLFYKRKMGRDKDLKDILLIESFV